MNDKTEASISIVVALFVLLSAMVDPRISAGIAIVFLLALAVYKFTRTS